MDEIEHTGSTIGSELVTLAGTQANSLRGKIDSGYYRCHKTESEGRGIRVCHPALLEEMANDDLVFADIERVIATGRIRRRFTRDPRGTRYEIIGSATEERKVAVICRLKETGKLLFITRYALE